MTKRLNNPHVCILCARRADGLAVGKPDQLAWLCFECGIERAKDVLKMPNKEFDKIEQLACKAVADLCGTSEITLSKDELSSFIQWAVQEFGEAIRKKIDAPF